MATPDTVSRYLNHVFTDAALPSPLLWRDDEGGQCYTRVYHGVLQKLQSKQWMQGKAAMVQRLHPDWKSNSWVAMGILSLAACLEVLNGEAV